MQHCVVFQLQLEARRISQQHEFGNASFAMLFEPESMVFFFAIHSR